MNIVMPIILRPSNTHMSRKSTKIAAWLMVKIQSAMSIQGLVMMDNLEKDMHFVMTSLTFLLALLMFKERQELIGRSIV